MKSSESKLEFYKQRNQRIVTFSVGDEELKKRMRAAAKVDGRSVNNWLMKYVVPHLESEVDRQLRAADRAGKR